MYQELSLSIRSPHKCDYKNCVRQRRDREEGRERGVEREKEERNKKLQRRFETLLKII